MPPAQVSDDALVEAYTRTGSQRAVVRETGLPRTTVRRRLKRLAQQGRFIGGTAPMPGFEVSRVAEGPRGRIVEQRPEHGAPFEAPAGHLVKGVSVLLDPDGREIVKWVKTREDGGVDPFTLAGWLKEFFADYAGPGPAPPPARVDDALNLVPLADLHVGLHTWGKEVGQSWDLKIAEAKLGAAIDELFERTPAASQAVVLGGGDLTHTDDNTNATPASKHSLQADGRYPKIIEVSCRLVLRVIESALLKHETVLVRLLPGNHDPHAHIAVAYFLAAYWRNEPRVVVDLDPSLFWWHRFGSVYLAATHGHTLKGAPAKELPMLMAAHRPDIWGATAHRYAHSFHLHHTAKAVDEIGGVVTEVHQAPVPADVFAFGSGYVSGRSLQSITYDAERGEIGRARVAIK